MKPSAQEFNKALFTWFEKDQRYFPWREVDDPYAIWVSEIMSQQTQITRVAEKFWPNFMKKFPTVFDLAKADWEDVFPYWDGLGYYRRGKNVLLAAKKVTMEFGGVFPEDPKELEQLPGVGKYTAAAVAAFAFDAKVPAVDTNVSKIIRTLWDKEELEETAKKLVESSTSGKVWNSAMMDLASSLRIGKVPGGRLGSFFPPEVARQFIPQRKKGKKPVAKKTKKKLIEVGIACIWRDGKYLIQSRPKGKSFVGFWEFPGGKREIGETFRDCVKREIEEEVGISVSVRPHFYEEVCRFKEADLKLRFHRAQIQKGEPKALEGQTLDWIDPKDFFGQKFLPTNHKALRHLQKMRVS